MVKFPSLEKLRLSDRLWNTLDHVIVGEGSPVAMHDGKVKSFPSMTYIGRWDNGLILGVAIEELEVKTERIISKLYGIKKIAAKKPR